jgi:radical SAM protein with 4Fe4S-binding SPASM domain
VKQYTHWLPPAGFLGKVSANLRRMSSPRCNIYNGVLVPRKLLKKVRAQILSTHATFGQPIPSKDELYNSVLSAVKQAGSVDRLRELAASGRLAEATEVRPLKLEMDLLNKCNLRCPMCMMSHPSHYRQPLKRMSLEQFERLAAEVFWHVRSLSFTFGAEPLLHPEFSRFVEIASRYRIPQIYAVTNGTLLTEAVARAIITHGMDVLAVSIDAARPETYSQIRVGGDWDSLMRNLQTFNRLKRELDSPKPRLELTFVMMKTNIPELPELVELADQLGASSVNAIHMLPFECLGMGHESCSLDKEYTNEILQRAQARAGELGVQFSGPPLFHDAVTRGSDRQGAEKFDLPVSQATRMAGYCPFPWHFAAIDMYGDVVPCGWWNNQPGMGSILSDSLLSIWTNERYQKLRAEHRSGALCATCRHCPAAGTGSVDCEGSFRER